MGEKLESVFALAHTKGGMALAAKLAFKTRITSKSAAAMPDDPETLERVNNALEELIRDGAGIPTPKAAPPIPQKTGGELKRYFDLARQHGGLLLAVKMAAKTGITSEEAAAMPDTPEVIEKARKALAELLPGVSLPKQ